MFLRKNSQEVLYFILWKRKLPQTSSFWWCFRSDRNVINSSNKPQIWSTDFYDVSETYTHVPATPCFPGLELETNNAPRFHPWSISSSTGLLENQTNTVLTKRLSSTANALSQCSLSKLSLNRTCKQQCSIRQYSNRHGQDDVDDEEQEARRRKLGGAVMYITNPISWCLTKWNIAKLRRMFDPDFREDEFLVGAQQAISLLLQNISEGRFEQLAGLVVEEVVDWLKSYRISLSDLEQRALRLQLDEMILMKIRNIQVENKKDKALVFVDSVCFGLKLADSVPYLVDLGIRFKRDYATDPPGNWMVAGVTHIRLQNMTPK